LSFILVGLSEGAPIRRASIRRIQQVTEGYDTRVDFAILNQQLPAIGLYQFFGRHVALR